MKFRRFVRAQCRELQPTIPEGCATEKGTWRGILPVQVYAGYSLDKSLLGSVDQIDGMDRVELFFGIQEEAAENSTLADIYNLGEGRTIIEHDFLFDPIPLMGPTLRGA